jgi:hypothetical protein
MDLHAMKEAETPDGHSIPERTPIPPNIYVTGTVNVDETTFLYGSTKRWGGPKG